ncbi:MAG: glycosyltransferase [Massilibacteroides sp.]|nr:glycosyltransferase [Massilibacteroides sp.]MDD3062262.1 glycosyltransferase [Massilibacteroides sp.]MDD4113999.1 glycosyltransferase [Massilibacteroides sp.]MDD4660035.1 glycosyltransferase [Massilibacteroides sp.]
MNKLISIIIPVYNVQEKYLRQCIESAINQTYVQIEIILINDGSTDPHILPTLNSFQEKDKRIVVINKKNEGVTYARQTGIENARGEYIMFLDCDDFLTPNAAESLYIKAKQNNALIIIGNHWMLHEDGQKELVSLTLNNGKEAYIKALLSGNCNGTIWAKLFQKSVFSEISLLTVTNGKKDNDTLFNYLLADKIKSERIICLGESIYFWRQRADSTTQSQVKLADESIFFIVEWVNKFVHEHFDVKEIENELALFNLKIWSLSFAWGLICPNKSSKKELYEIYWKNKSARKQLSNMERTILLCEKNPLLSFLYKIYQNTIKPVLKENFLSFYLKLTRKNIK